MYVKQNNKDRRANSFIVSGLQGNYSTADSILVKNLCRDELRLSVDILSTKRIGKEIATKPRHLLVYTRSRDQAVAITQSDRKLRKSDDLFVMQTFSSTQT